MMPGSAASASAKSPLFVVPVDFSPDMEGCVSAAFALARRCGAGVHLLEVVSPRGPSLLGDALAPGSSSGDKSRLDNAIKTAARSRIAVKTASYRGDPAPIILSYMQLVKARLLVIGLHYGTPRWRRSARIAGTLCRAAPGPVLVLPPGASAKATERAFGHILSAVDFTVASAVAVRTTVGLIRQTGARVTLVHALQNAPHRPVYSGAAAARVARNLRGQAAHLAERLRKKTPADVRIRVDARITTGAPHHGILEVASEVNADLIVMGVPPRSRLDEMLFGSTLRNVLRRTKIPMLVLPVHAGAYKALDVNSGM
jgi:nucleotide-binding universal stress UspA family protein